MLDELHGMLIRAEADEAGEGEYQLLRWIGGGSFGKVYLVLHRDEGRQFVMKEFSAFADMDGQQREATKLEVQLLREVQHPNIVGYRDSYVNQGGCLCIFMEYCEHGDVHSYLQSGKRAARHPPCEAQVLEWLVQVTLALQALHARRILHRDLKTQNIFLTSQGLSVHQHGNGSGCFALKLGDLGIARVLSSTMELAATQIGTPFSMSPEVFNNKPYGYQSDVWGLGCVLYELVNNGQHAFDAQSINGLALKILRGRYTPVTANCSDEAKQLIKLMLNTNPKRRPTLQAILQSPSVRRQVPTAVYAAAQAAGSKEQQARAEEVLRSQLGALGLAAAAQQEPGSGTPGGGRPGAASPPRGTSQPRKAPWDRRQALLQQRIERAERRKKREEDTLKRLQETAEVLKNCLRGMRQPPEAIGGLGAPSGIAPCAGGGRGGPINGYSHTNCGAGGCASARSSGYGGPNPSSFRGQWRPLAPPVPIPPASQAHSNPLVSNRSEQSGPELGDEPVMSHRDRVLLRKEQRREEEHQRFEEEARKIREENLAYQRAWVQESREHGHGGAARHHGGQLREPAVERAAGSTESGLLWNAAAATQSTEYGLTPEQLANPFRTRRPNVLHTPRQRVPNGDACAQGANRHSRSRAESINMPCPPPARHSEPVPPSNGPIHRWNHWGGDHGSTGVTSRSLHSVCLESLADQPNVAEHSEESEFSGSLSDGSDVGCGWGDDEQLRRQSQGVQRRIVRCRAMIATQSSTIEALQRACAGAQSASESATGDGCPAAPLEVDDARQRFQLAAAARRPALEAPPGGASGASGLLRGGAGLLAPPRAAASAPAVVRERLARLRRCCLEGLGIDTFQAARGYLQSLLDTQEVATAVRERMLEMLGLDKIGYFALIDQIVHMEHLWGVHEPDHLRRLRCVASDTGSDTGLRSGNERWSGAPFRRSRSPGWDSHCPVGC